MMGIIWRRPANKFKAIWHEEIRMKKKSKIEKSESESWGGDEELIGLMGCFGNS